MRYRYGCLFLILMFALFQVGCGSQPGAPGSDGDTGVIVDATVIPNYLGGDTYSVDVVQQICDPGPPPTIEDFTDHSVVLHLIATLERPDLAIQPGNLYVEEYTIDFYRDSDSVGAPPIMSDRRFFTIVIPAPVGGGTTDLTATLVMVDLPRKDKYLSDMLTGQYTSALGGFADAIINNYTVVYTFYGKNEFGTDFRFTASAHFQIGNFDYCT
jgi:hypothetical protein